MQGLATWWTWMFGSGPSLTTGQETARAILIFVYGLALIRLAGRRTFRSWSGLDTVVSILIGSNLSRALTGNAALLGTLVATTVLVALHWLLARLVVNSSLASTVLEGAPITLVEAGKVVADAPKRHAVSDNDLGEALRQAGVEHPEDTRLIVLEPSGQLSVLKSNEPA